MDIKSEQSPDNPDAEDAPVKVEATPLVEEPAAEGTSFINVLDEDGELKHPSVLKKELVVLWGRLKQKALEAVTGPLKKAGQDAAIETLTRVFGSLDSAIDGMEGKKPEKDKRQR